MTKTLMPLADAEAAACALLDKLAPYCMRLDIAGSIRRKKPQIADIELVAIPRMAAGQMDLFGDVVDYDLLEEKCGRLLAEGTFTLRPDKNGVTANGQRFKRLLFGFRDMPRVPLDLFIVREPAQFGVIFTIRTGCAEFSHRLVTSRLLGGWLPAGMQVRNGGLYAAGALQETPEEADFFEAIGVIPPPPERRTPDAQVQLVTWEGMGKYSCR